MKQVALVLLLFLVSNNFANTVNAKVNYSDKDSEALRKFRLKIPDVISRTKDEYRKSNEFLIKWIQDQDYDLVKAEEKLKKSIQWRLENDVDKILHDFSLNIPALVNVLPYSDLGKDKDVRPTFAIPLGRWNLRRFVIAGKLDVVIRRIIYIFESTVETIKDSWKNGNYNATQWNFITNFAGYTAREHGCFGCISYYIQLVTIYENNYPLHGKRVVVINSPRIFDSMLQLVRPLMSPASKELLKIFSVNKSEWQQYLATFINVENLPLEYGGLKTSKSIAANKNNKLQ